MLDADQIAGEVLGREEIVRRLVDAFDGDIVGPDGFIDRAALADAAFRGSTTAARLNGVVHPEVEKALLERLKELEDAADPPGVVVLDIPLLDAVPEVAARASAVVAIEAPVDARVARLVARGMAEDDMRRRIAVQPTDAERRRGAAAVVINDADEFMFTLRLDEVWDHLAGPGSPAP